MIVCVYVCVFEEEQENLLHMTPYYQCVESCNVHSEVSGDTVL